MTDFMRDAALAGDTSHDGDCADCPIPPNALVSVPGEPGALDRRAFLTRAMLSAAVLALAACGAGNGTTAPFSGTTSLNINDYPALANVGGVALVTLNGSPVALVRNSATSVLALSRVCPHQGGTINTGGGGFICPRHGAQFNLTGQWVGGQPTSNMQSYATTFDPGTGALTIG
jgi:nitrite reductase/ring-hydroxylating ferredoxin subunit